MISKKDEWIIEAFPTWGITGSRSKYVFAERSVKTQYSRVRERVYLHRLILGAGPDNKAPVDHIDRDRLNNRRENLRACAAWQNMGNMGTRRNKKFKGVQHAGKGRNLKKPYCSWISSLDLSGSGTRKRKYLGHFETEIEAAKAYDVAAREVWGEFAFQNFPEPK